MKDKQCLRILFPNKKKKKCVQITNDRQPKYKLNKIKFKKNKEKNILCELFKRLLTKKNILTTNYTELQKSILISKLNHSQIKK